MPQRRGLSPDAMKSSGDNAALSSDAYLPPTTFTPINRPGSQLVTLQHFASPPSTDQTETIDSTGQRKQHHPIIARYLGLGVDKGPSHLDKLAPALPSTQITPAPKRKRNPKAHNGSSPTNAAHSKPKTSKQRRIPDSTVGFRVTKAASNSDGSHLKIVPAFSASLPATERCIDPSGQNDEHVEEARRSLRDANPTAKCPAQSLIDAGTTTLTQAFAALTNTSPSSSCTLVTSNKRPRYEASSQDTIAADEFFDDVFDSMDLDSTSDPTPPNPQPPDTQIVSICPYLADSSATICGDDDSLLSRPELTDDFSPLVQSNESMNACNMGLVDKGFAANSSLESQNGSGPSGKFKPPITGKTEALMSNAAMRRGHTTDRKPIVRSLFPDQVLDRSPIIGLSSRLLLRTSFRVGEAINQAGKAAKQGQNLMFELYARVISSERDAAKQHFVFSDIFHERPPYLKGEYDATIWKQVELFNYDSGRFLSKAEMCRCIGQIKRNEKNKTWVMVVLNIWEATWEDIDWVAGIVNS
ncbi:hypothetical protein SLS60_002323 [Paraconiothyrium brasiliense]|uniref:Uncharacterized protein n=1 Tax=Paraconiothyrium brasiliense TaxID=300254 RepID=A0ABR3S2D9_9PLEO